MRKAVDWAVETQGVDLQDFDQNEDGSIDAVWLVNVVITISPAE